MASQPNTREQAAWTPRDQMTVLNQEQRRVDGPEKVTGRAVYAHDVRLPNMVYARLLVYPYSRATIKKIDVSAARDVPGVVYAAPVSDDKVDVKYQGADCVLAVVAGETPEAADDGVRAVLVEAEELDALVTPEQAAAADAPQLARRGGNVGSYRARGEEQPALDAVDAADVKVDATYSVPIQHHVCFETHGSVVDYKGDSAVVYSSTQAVSGSPRGYSGMLGLEGNVRVLCEYMGGGFGSKFGPGFEDSMACKVAKELKRPVHLLLTRPQEFLMAGNRSGGKQHIVAGANKDGKMVGLSMQADRYGGMGGGSLPSFPYIYEVETSHSAARSVRTATDANRAMRAPGHPQGSFAMESIVDELAYAIAMDTLEFRKTNLTDPVYHRQLDRVAAELDWANHPHRSAPGPNDGTLREGIGFGVAQWGSSGRAGSKVEVRITPDGAVTSSTGTQDLGQGSRTYVAGIVAEELGLPLERVTARIGDSDLPPSGASGGSVTTGSLAPAVKHAAHLAREALEAKLVDALGGEVGSYVWKDGKVTAKDGGSLTFAQVCATLGTEPLMVTGEFQKHLHQPRVHGAQGARVSVDTLTGEVKVLKMVAIQDQGIPLNRSALRSQINGGMVQALSYALLEARVHDPDFGLMLTSNLVDYKIAGTLEMPEMVAIIDDDDTRQAVMGMAEATCIPGHGAIANAVFNACGARVRDLPLTPDKVLAALGLS